MRVRMGDVMAGTHPAGFALRRQNVWSRLNCSERVAEPLVSAEHGNTTRVRYDTRARAASVLNLRDFFQLALIQDRIMTGGTR